MVISNNRAVVCFLVAYSCSKLRNQDLLCRCTWTEKHMRGVENQLMTSKQMSSYLLVVEIIQTPGK